MSSLVARVHVETPKVAQEHEVFLRSLIRHLAGTIEDVIGPDEASGFFAMVGQRMGDELNTACRTALDVSRLDREQVRDLCLDLEGRIDGGLALIAEDDEKLVFGSRASPFGDDVLSHHALSTLASNVFGTIAAENLGYGKVVLEATVANGHAGCRVVLYVARTPASDAADGREYHGSE